MRLHRYCAFAVMALSIVLGGCEDEVMAPQGGGSGAKKKSSASASSSVEKPPEIAEFTPDDFVESEESRDPFRDYRHLFEAKTPEARVVQRPVKASEYASVSCVFVTVMSFPYVRPEKIPDSPGAPSPMPGRATIDGGT